MEKQIISTEPYLLMADQFNIERHEFLHKYIPDIVRRLTPGVNFTSLDTHSIELAEGLTLPTVDTISANISFTQQMFKRDFNVFERTYEDGILVRETYSLPAIRDEALALIALLPTGFDLTDAFSIGTRKASGRYDQEYITVYFKNDYAARGAVSHSIKLNAVSKEIIDIKLLFSTIPAEYAVHIPDIATSTLIGIFEYTKEVVDVYFALSNEDAYINYLGSQYISPQPTTLGLGMIGLSINTIDNRVIRTKRYTF